MDITAYLALFFSLVVSILVSLFIFLKKASKWLGLLAGFCTNCILLLAATFLFSKTFHVKELEGVFAGLGLVIFIFFIPINTCINFYFLETVKSRR